MMMMMASRGKGEVSSSYFLAEEDGSVNNDPDLQPMIGHSLLAINETCPEDDDYLEDSPEMMASSSRKRPREDEVGNEGLLRSPIMRWDPRDNLPAKVKEGLKDIIDETAAASTLVTCPLSRASYSYSSSSSSSSSSTVTTATKRDPEERLNRAIHRYWQKLIDQFDNGPALREVMDIISRYADQILSIKETFSKLGAVFQKYGCEELYEGLVLLLLQQDVRKEFLSSKGVDITFLNNKPTVIESEDEEEEFLQEQPDMAGHLAKRARKEKQRTRKHSKKSSRKDEDEDARQRSSPDKWTPEEDEKLVALVQKYGVDTKKWRQIAEELGTTKNSAKCAQHWRRVLAPSIHKGSWTIEEEEKLLAGVKQHGLTQWTLVAKEIPGRTDIQCRYHYMRQLNSRKIAWTIEEENMLANLVKLHGEDGAWVKISDKLAENKIRRTPRTALECRQQWVLMRERDPKELALVSTSDVKKKKKKKKKNK